MELLFLGVGPGLSSETDIYQSNMVLKSDSGKRLLIDCGTDIRISLTKANLSPDDLDGVYISHLHSDHAGGLEWIALSRKFLSKKPKPKLFIHPTLADRLWSKSLSGAMETLGKEEATLSTFFDVVSMDIGKSLKWDGLSLEAIRTKHVISNGELMPSFGLMIDNQEKSWFITTDTQFSPEEYQRYYEKADLIFHDCELLEKPSTVHSHYKELQTLPQNIRNKIWLYHYQNMPHPDAKKDGFNGFVAQGQVF